MELSALVGRAGNLELRLSDWGGVRQLSSLHVAVSHYESLQLLWSRLEGYDVWHMDPTIMSTPSPVTPTTKIGPRGEHAAAVLDHLRDLDPKKYESLQAELRRCAPELERVVARAVPGSNGVKEIVFVEKGGAQLPCSQVSDGLRFLLFFLLILHSPEVPRTMAFEDIEHGLHPRRIKDVVGFLRQLSRGPDQPQVLLTTHSPLVLDEFRDCPEQVVVVERGAGGATTCTPLPDRLATLQGANDATLGDLWFSGVLGGVPNR